MTTTTETDQICSVCGSKVIGPFADETRTCDHCLEKIEAGSMTTTDDGTTFVHHASVTYEDDGGGLTVCHLTEFLSGYDPDLPLVLAFVDAEGGVVWRYSGELRFDLFASNWYDLREDDGPRRNIPVIEMHVAGELIVESDQ